MRILLTNDDGVYAEGIYALYSALKSIASVTVVAPESQMSSVGHAITLGHPIWHTSVKRKGKVFGYGVQGTPADCVKFATAVLMKQKPDLVISGINLGPNDGCSVFYSGTVAGAREGALMGIPSIAISLGTFKNPDFTYASKIGRKVAKLVHQNKLPKGTFLNVNVPHVSASKIKGIKITQQGTAPIHGEFDKRKDPYSRDYYWLTGIGPKVTQKNHIDTNALASNYVAVTPVHCDMTDYRFLEELSQWKV